MSSSIMDRLRAGTVLGAEGYVFELERRGYIKAGPFVPEVVLDFPDAVRELHRRGARHVTVLGASMGGRIAAEADAAATPGEIDRLVLLSPAGIGAPAMPQPGTGPRGPAVVGAANLTVRGTVKAFDRGVSITVTEANGKARTVPLAEKASVYDGLAVGDKVAVRIPLQKPADGKHADRIERQKPPKDAPASKFSQAQTPKS